MRGTYPGGRSVAARLFAPQFLVLYWFAITAMIVHFRGRDRLTFTRQLTDHSTLLAPYNVLMYWFSVLPNRPVLPAASIPELAKLRENWQIIRGEGLALSEQGRRLSMRQVLERQQVTNVPR
jgi:beta-hydroxylase